MLILLFFTSTAQQDIALTALEICQGLAYLHAPPRRLVHRDLSAANVLLDTADNSRGFAALVSDFGLTTGQAKRAALQIGTHCRCGTARNCYAQHA